MSPLNLIPGGPLIRAMVVAAALAAVAAAITWQVKNYNEGLREEGRIEVRLQVLADQRAAAWDKSKRDDKLRYTNEKIDQTIQRLQADRAAAAGALADSLRQLNAALANGEPGPANPAAPGSPDAAGTTTADAGADPRPRIARECAAALVEVERRVHRLADEKRGLQAYATNVCLAAGAPPPGTSPPGQAPNPVATGPPGD